MRYEIYAGSGLNMETARAVLIANGATNVREAYRDMGTWWGTNQPRTLAFSLPESEADALEKIVSQYREQTGSGSAYVQTRRTRKAPGKSRLVALA